jgi:ribosome-associated toxin RatA of RatAB toxin-antitoxin module
MITVARQAIVPYSAAAMYALVAEIERYPEFLPWCSGTEVLEQSEDKTTATIKVSYRGVRQEFTTENRNTPGERIELTLVRGPFRAFRGEWRFTPLGEGGCKVELTLAYQFSSAVLDRLAGPVFDYIANTFVDAFVGRAEALHSA